MLFDRGLVKFYLTQNIDNLEAKAGFSPEQMVQAHGANTGAVCSLCGAEQDRQLFETHVAAGTVMYCHRPECNGPVKPNIVFFGEVLPLNMYQIASAASGDTDLLIIIGTSLSVAPFNKVVDLIKDCVPKVLINLENTDTMGYDFCDQELFPERLFVGGRCQEAILQLAAACGWQDELLQRKQTADAIHDGLPMEIP